MADSKISDLPLSPFILDKDLMVVVTGSLEEGSFPQNIKVPLGYIRKYIVRLNLLTSAQSGISTYYNSGANILTINHSPLTGNLVRYDYSTDFPYKQTISTTGLNCLPGNNIEINFSSEEPAALTYGNTGPPYHSGIISTTGLNVIDSNGIAYSIESQWPHKYSILNSEKTKTQSGIINIYNNDNNFETSISGYNLLSLDYADFYTSKKDQSFKVLCTAGFKISSIAFGTPPFVPGIGLTNERKYQELSSYVNFNGDPENYEPLYTLFVAGTYDLKIGIKGGTSNTFVNIIHTYPITFKNSNGPNAADCSEIYRSGTYGFGFNSIDPIILIEPITLILNSNTIDELNSLSIYATISNVKYARTYTNGEFSYTTNNTYSSTQASIYPLFIKTENII